MGRYPRLKFTSTIFNTQIILLNGAHGTLRTTHTEHNAAMNYYCLTLNTALNYTCKNANLLAQYL